MHNKHKQTDTQHIKQKIITGHQRKQRRLKPTEKEVNYYAVYISELMLLEEIQFHLFLKL